MYLDLSRWMLLERKLRNPRTWKKSRTERRWKKLKVEVKMFWWDTPHSQYLCKYLVNQVQNGMKVDKGFKTACLKQVDEAIHEEFKVDIQLNVKNHLRTFQLKWDEVQKISKNSSGAYLDYDKGHHRGGWAHCWWVHQGYEILHIESWSIMFFLCN